MNYTFKGQVKISDVQAAFDSLLSRINTIINDYNTADTLVSNLDLSVGGPTLAAGGYTLSVGGIKQILSAYAGLLIGVRAFRIDETHVAVTDGFYFTEDEQPVRINAQILEGNGYYIYFDPTDNSLGLVNDDAYPEGTKLILDLSASDDRVYLNEFRDIQLAEVPGYKLRIQKRHFNGDVQADDNTIHRFQGGGLTYVPKGGAGGMGYRDAKVDIDYITRGYSDGNKHRRHQWLTFANFLFIPKGCNTPLVVRDGTWLRRTQYTVELDKEAET
jgi:hypothetical protein